MPRKIIEANTDYTNTRFNIYSYNKPSIGYTIYRQQRGTRATGGHFQRSYVFTKKQFLPLRELGCKWVIVDLIRLATWTATGTVNSSFKDATKLASPFN
jgi:hypothetical protein